MGLWSKSVLVFNSIREHGQQSIRRLAQRTGLSIGSMHRHRQAINRRNCYPEASFWETKGGRNWLIRLVVATLNEDACTQVGMSLSHSVRFNAEPGGLSCYGKR